MEDREDIDAMVDEILGSADAGKKEEYPFVLKCTQCGQIFGAKTKGAKLCPSCRRKAKANGGRKGAEKAHGLAAPRTERQDARKAPDPALWEMPGTWEFWKKGFSKHLGFFDFVEGLRAAGIEVHGLEREE